MYLRFFIMLLAFFASNVFSAEQELKWAGCDVTKKAFMQKIAVAYQAKTGTKINLTNSSATKGIRLTASHLSDIGSVCRHRLEVEGVAVGTELRTQLYQVAWDALVVITHPDNPITDISLGYLKEVYDGIKTNWADVGGENKKIMLATRKGRYSGVGNMFRILVFEYQEHEYFADSKTFPSTDLLEKYIAKTPFSLGIDGVNSARKSKLKILSLDGVTPSKENIASGKYPLFRPLYLVTSNNAPPEVMKLVGFTLGSEGQRIISEQGTVNLEEGKALIERWDHVKKIHGLN